MGRTNPTYRDRLARTRSQWSDFRRGLRARDHDAYDRLWTYAADYADAAGYHNPDRVELAVLLAVALAQERRLDGLETRVDDLESRLAALDSGGEDDPGD